MFLADKALILLFNIRHDDLLEKFTLRLKNKVALQYVLIMSLSLYLQTALIKTLGAPFQRKTKPNTSTNITCHPPHRQKDTTNIVSPTAMQQQHTHATIATAAP
jgi:hypothetical protein